MPPQSIASHDPPSPIRARCHPGTWTPFLRPKDVKWSHRKIHVPKEKTHGRNRIRSNRKPSVADCTLPRGPPRAPTAPLDVYVYLKEGANETDADPDTPAAPIWRDEVMATRPSYAILHFIFTLRTSLSEDSQPCLVRLATVYHRTRNKT